ncbi:hypothetical protein PL321_12445 [Caloramator sp. mosi_1]|uniref:hypothetical protein n=1 Tax=Caloramator sp. mosi_1 TaxID=3023090 RepID=UPI00235E329F|nr:hypothetical protein [Caloramator sp. mosi_1]WDC83509.1 hypothetical protein PL321_12445 [Caloramator sp. mosi_1]
MDKNTELLNYIYKNSQMGIETINQLLKETKDENLKSILQRHLSEYQKFYNITQNKLKSKNIEPKELNFYQKHLLI